RELGGTLGAERGPGGVHGAEPRTVTDDRLRAALEQPLESPELSIDALKLGGLLRQDVHLDVVADSHLIEETPELGLHQGKALGEAVSLSDEVRVGLGRQRLDGPGVGIASKPDRHGTEIWLGR